MFAIANLSTTPGDVITIGGAATSAWVDPIVSSVVNLGPSGMMVFTSPLDGFSVTASTYNLKVGYTGVSGSINYDVILIGNV